MRQSLKRATTRALVLPTLLYGWILSPQGAWAVPLLVPRPGPIEHPLSIASADFDRDGYDDLAIAGFQAGVIQILINQRDGTFAPTSDGPYSVGAASFSNPTSGPIDMVVVDLNPEDVDGDGVPNAKDNCPNAYNPVDSTTTVQLDTDHDLVGDACAVGTDSNGDGTIDVTIDTDGDGILDFDPINHTLDNCPHFPNPLQEDTNTASGPDGLCGTSDDNSLLNGIDGICGTPDDRVGDGVGDACAASPDLMIVTTSAGSGSPFGDVRVRLNNGVGGLVSRASYLTSVGPGNLAIADFTGDKRADFAVTVSSVDIAQFQPGLTDGNFGAPVAIVVGDGPGGVKAGPQGLATGDFNGDGHPDLAVAARSIDTLAIYLNAGAGLPTKATATLATKDAPTVVLSGRINGDSFDDLVVLDQSAQPNGGQVEVFLGSAAGTLSAGPVFPLPPPPGGTSSPRSGLLRDLDADGNPDLAVADFDGGQVLLYHGVGDGTFTLAATLSGVGSPADLATLNFDTASPTGPDLAVLDYQRNRVLLFRNDGGMAFVAPPTSPASPWRDTSAMAVFGADFLVAADIVLLQRRTARLDTLSGIGDGSFRPISVLPLKGPFTASMSSTADASSMEVADLRQDGRPDIAIVDGATGGVTIVTNEFLTGLTEQETIPSGPGTSQVATGSLSSDVDDYDRDGVPNLLDDCPTVYNPPFCTVQDAACPATILCTDVTLTPTACNPADPATLDPTTFQCDTDQNGIGDHCQVLTPPVTSGTCAALDSDFDTKVDYNPNAILKLPNGYDFDRDLVPNLEDNCPTTINGDQADLNNNGIGDACETLTGGQLSDPDLDNVPTFNPLTLALDNCPGIYNPGQEDNDGDGVGNACVITAALDNCTYTINTNQGDKNGDGVGDQCALAPIDLLTVNPGPGPATGTVSVWGGDGSGRFHALASSPLGGALQHPTSAASGHFTLSCTVLPPPIPPICHGKTAFDIAVAEQATPGNLTDDRVTVFDGDGFGAFVAVPPVAVQGDPSQLIVSHDQQLCGNPRDPAHPSLRHDLDGVSDFLAVVEPGTSSIGVLLPSNQNAATPGLSSLVSPTGFPTPLPVPGVLIGAFFTDLNQDGRIDIVALSAPASGPSLITLYIGMGNGLFFTDPTINPDPVPGPISLAAGANIDLKTDSFFPDLVLFDTTDQTPIVLTNVIGERSDTDDSGRVDGRDLAILARAFGATRGEDFTIQPSNGTLLQIGAGASRIVVGGGAFKPGQDIPPVGANCDNLFEPLSGRYGLPADINLDGTVDGKDLAFLAGLFGKAVP